MEDAGFENPFPAEEKWAPFMITSTPSGAPTPPKPWPTPSRSQPGEEEPGTGKGRLAEFTVNGALINTWDGGNYLNAPWESRARRPTDTGPTAASSSC